MLWPHPCTCPPCEEYPLEDPEDPPPSGVQSGPKGAFEPWPPPGRNDGVFAAPRTVRRMMKVMVSTTVAIEPLMQSTGISSHQAELSDTAAR
jgi:hypothetical protein